MYRMCPPSRYLTSGLGILLSHANLSECPLGDGRCQEQPKLLKHSQLVSVPFVTKSQLGGFYLFQCPCIIDKEHLERPKMTIDENACTSDRGPPCTSVTEERTAEEKHVQRRQDKDCESTKQQPEKSLDAQADRVRYQQNVEEQHHDEAALEDPGRSELEAQGPTESHVQGAPIPALVAEPQPPSELEAPAGTPCLPPPSSLPTLPHHHQRPTHGPVPSPTPPPEEHSSDVSPKRLSSTPGPQHHHVPQSALPPTPPPSAPRIKDESEKQRVGSSHAQSEAEAICGPSSHTLDVTRLWALDKAQRFWELQNDMSPGEGEFCLTQPFSRSPT